jgi:MerR family transcriptional regulator, thiopeptide resistance regulator
MKKKSNASTAMHHAREFAELAGVSVRTLHHYDRLGLLKARRNGSGYRLYHESDLERLEQIVALKFLGLPLKDIRELLDSAAPELPDALRMQRRALEEKRRLLDRAIAAIHEAEAVVATGRQTGAAVLKKIIEVIEMQQKNNWTKYANEAAREKIATRQGDWSPELQERVSQQWIDLIAEVQAAMDSGEPPASPKARAFAARWKALVEEFTKRDPDVTQAVSNAWKDRANWPKEAQEQSGAFEITPAMWRWIHDAMGGSCSPI